MKIIIAGDGKVGFALTRQLSAEGYDITLIDSNTMVLEDTVNRYDVMSVGGNCASIDVLQEAGVKTADLLIATTAADEINLLCCLTAHKLNPRLHAIARIRNPEYSKHIYSMTDAFALSLSVNPEKLAAIEIEQLLKYPGFLQRDTFAKGRASIVELQIGKDNPACGNALNRLNQFLNCKVLVCAVIRNGEAVTPGGNFVLQEGDRIFVTAPTDNLVHMLKSFGIFTRRVRSVLICGGSRICYYLAQQLLKSGIRVTIIEKDAERCDRLATMLPKASIVKGDASSQTLLESENITKYDALVAMTGLDEVNLIISLFASTCKVPQVITKLGHSESLQIAKKLPVGSIVNPQELCSDTIVRYVRALKNKSGAAVAVHTIADEQAEAEEFHIDETSRYCNVPLKDIPLKKNVLIVCINHGIQTEIPDGNSVFVQGDTVIVVTGTRNLVKAFNDIFRE